MPDDCDKLERIARVWKSMVLEYNEYADKWRIRNCKSPYEGFKQFIGTKASEVIDAAFVSLEEEMNDIQGKGGV